MNSHGVGRVGVSHCSLKRVLHVLLSVDICWQTSLHAKECLWSKTCVGICSLGGALGSKSLLFPRVRGSEWEPEGLVLCREGENSGDGFQRLQKEHSGGGRKRGPGKRGGGGGERDRERKRTHYYYHTFKLSQDTNLMEPTITCSSPLPS